MPMGERAHKVSNFVVHSFSQQYMYFSKNQIIFIVLAESCIQFFEKVERPHRMQCMVSLMFI